MRQSSQKLQFLSRQPRGLKAVPFVSDTIREVVDHLLLHLGMMGNERSFATGYTREMEEKAKNPVQKG
jgi:hypothetical protein